MLKDELVQPQCSLRLPRKTIERKDISQSRYAETNRAVAHVTALRLRRRVEVNINNPIQVANGRLRCLAHILKVKGTIVKRTEGRQSK